MSQLGKEGSKVIGDMVKNTFTPTGKKFYLPDGTLYDEDKDRAETYAKAFKMDAANKKMAVVAATQGFDQAAKEMVKEFTSDEGFLDYASMRARYG
jgi:hypothetical protein